MTERTFPNRLRFDVNPSQIEKLTEEAISTLNKSLDAIVAVPKEKRTFENTIKAFADAEGEFASARSTCDFPSSVSTDKETRDASNAAATKLDAAQTLIFSRSDLYNSIKEYESQNPDSSKLEGEEGRLLEYLLKDYRRSGMALDQQSRDRVPRSRTK